MLGFVFILGCALVRVLVLILAIVGGAKSWALVHQTHLVLDVDGVHGGGHHGTVIEIVSGSHVELLWVLVGGLARLVSVASILLLDLHVSVFVLLTLSWPSGIPVSFCVRQNSSWSMWQQQRVIVLSILVDVYRLEVLALENSVGSSLLVLTCLSSYV